MFLGSFRDGVLVVTNFVLVLQRVKEEFIRKERNGRTGIGGREPTS